MGGGEKALLPLGGVPVLHRVIAAAEPLRLPMYVMAAADPSIALRHSIAAARERFPELALQLNTDLVTDRGPLGGLFSAFEHSAASLILLLACDLPFLRTGLLELLLQRREPRFDLVVPRDNFGLQPLCSLYSESCVGLLRNALDAGALSATSFAGTLRARILTASDYGHLDSDSLLFANLNTPEDYQRAELALPKTSI